MNEIIFYGYKSIYESNDIDKINGVNIDDIKLYIISEPGIKYIETFRDDNLTNSLELNKKAVTITDDNKNVAYKLLAAAENAGKDGTITLTYNR